MRAMRVGVVRNAAQCWSNAGAMRAMRVGGVRNVGATRAMRVGGVLTQPVVIANNSKSATFERG